jgi:hypothetical protein
LSVLHQQENSSIFAFHSTQGFARSALSLVFSPHDHSQQKWMNETFRCVKKMEDFSIVKYTPQMSSEAL